MIHKNKIFDKTYDIGLYVFVSAMLTVLVLLIFFRVHKMDWNVPVEYFGDSAQALVKAQNIINGYWIWTFPNIGAPAVMNWAPLPNGGYDMYALMWLLSLFIKESGLLVNMTYFLSFIFCAMAATYALRLLKIDGLFSALGGVLYTFLPFHILRFAHLYFSFSMTLIPLACAAALWTLNGEMVTKNATGIYKLFPVNNKKFVIAAASVALVSLSEFYYAFFTILCLLISLIWNLINKEYEKSKVTFSLLLIMFVFVTLCLIPYIQYLQSGNTVETTLTLRSRRDVEWYSLKLPDLLLPLDSHIIPLFAKVRQLYADHISLVGAHEGYTSALGIFIGMGLVSSVYLALDRKSRDSTIRFAASLNILLLLVGMHGGVSSFIAFILYQFRCYNRLSVFIAFFSLFIVLYYLDYFWKNRFKRRQALMITAILALSLTDMDGGLRTVFVATNQHSQALYYSDKHFVEQIEAITPPNAMVFELPHVPATHAGSYKNIGAYEMAYPAIHSKTLRWSYNYGLDAGSDKWLDAVSVLPTEYMLRALAASGFKGIYIDRNGYETQDADTLSQEIETISGVSPIFSENTRQEYFLLNDYFAQLEKDLTDSEKNAYSYHAGSGFPLLSGIAYNVGNAFGGALDTGWSGLEPWGVWSDGGSARLKIPIAASSNDVLFTMIANVIINDLDVDLYVNDKYLGKLDLSATRFVIPKDIANQNEIMDVEFRINNPAAPADLYADSQDSRMLGLGLIEYTLQENETEVQN